MPDANGDPILCWQCLDGEHRSCVRQWEQYGTELNECVVITFECECVEGVCIDHTRRGRPEWLEDGWSRIDYE